MYKYDPASPPPQPPQKIWKHELADLLRWYEANLCSNSFIDPRGMRVAFSPERFPHLIKLLEAGSDKEVQKPQKQVEAIRCGEKGNRDFGGYDTERAQTLTWIPQLIVEPSQILEVVERHLWAKPGDTLIVKEFDKQRGYRHKILVCRSVGNGILVPVTSHPRDHGSFGKQYKVVWP